MNIKNWFNANRGTFLAILIFLFISIAYFSPLLSGKVLFQSDISLLNGIHKEIFDYKEKTGETILWTNSLFGGMPTYQIWLAYPANISAYILRAYNAVLPHPLNSVFIYLLGFFILLRVLGCNTWLSIIGAIAFAFSSYNFIIIEAGHITKTIAIGLMPPIVAGVLLAYRGRFWTGAVLTAFFLALELRANHIQMTYYLALGILIYILVRLYYALREKELGRFIKASLVLAAAALLAIGINITGLWLTKEYADETIRGGTELTLNPQAVKTGLDRDYAFQYSHGVMESLTLFIPNYQGGASQGSLNKSSATYQALKDNGVPNATQIIKQLPLYWGDMPITSGPIYFGAIIMFLFILGLYLLKGPVKWWIVFTFLFSLLLSWGRHFELLSNVFFDYFPLYNKFRAVSSILVLASLVVPLLAVLLIKEILDEKIDQPRFIKGLKYTLYTFGGFLLLCIIMPGAFGSFTSDNDRTTFGKAYDFIIEPIISDRQHMFRMDALRSLVFILLASGLLYAYQARKTTSKYLVAGLGLLILIDMWAVNKRYLNDDNFVSKNKNKEELQPSQADLQILQDKDYYRVLNTTTNPFVDGNTSYFHKSIGGYHAAKLKRYQEIIENHLSKNNINVYNMLNTRYYIVKDQQTGAPQVAKNPDACGNAWFVQEIRYVANADSEMVALNNFNPKKTVIIDQRFRAQIGDAVSADSSNGTISLTAYHPNRLSYKSSATKDQFAVFSDIYYNKGWYAYIDGKPADYYRVNYLLRGMKIPAGDHTIEFKFAPPAYFTGEKIALICSILLVVLLLLPLIPAFRKRIRAQEA